MVDSGKSREDKSTRSEYTRMEEAFSIKINFHNFTYSEIYNYSGNKL